MQLALKSFFLSVMVTASAVVFSQDIDSLLLIQHAADPQEKLFVHFDKNYYNPGETIWFKAYLFQGLDRSKFTRNFYAELRDERGTLIDTRTAPVIMSGAASDIKIPDSLRATGVVFRAFTTNMLNGDTSFIYQKNIRVVQAPKKVASKPVVTAPELRFFPEGGDLVSGLQCNVGFACTGAGEVPAYCKGIIKDANGNQVTTFEALHDGMGHFLLEPQAGKPYTAVWKDEKGKEYNTILPPVKATGIALQVFDATESKQYTIRRSPDAPASMQRLVVVAIQNQQLVYQASINLTVKDAVRTQIPTAEMPTGIIQITVLDSNMKPVAERISFVNNSNFEFDADAWLPESNTQKRALNRGEIRIADTTAANLSVSITDADLDVDDPLHDNIVSRILLTGDLRGKIFNPYYYFYSTNDSVNMHLDMVMLTHGWRRYNWNNLLTGKVSPPKYLESDYITLTGKVIGSSGSFAEGLALNGFMRTKDSTNDFISLPIDRRGMISVPGMLFYDTARLFLAFSDKNRAFEPSMLNISNGLLETSLFPPLSASASKMPAWEPDTSVLSLNAKNNQAMGKVQAKRMKDAAILENVTVTAKAKTQIEKIESEYVSSMFRGGDGKSFDILNDRSAISSMSIFQYLQGRVAGLQITMNGSTPTASWRGGTPTFYLNEMRTDINEVNTIPMADIAYVKVISPGSAGVISNTGGGVIAIYTRKGGDVVRNDQSSLGVVKLRGYSPVKEFYSPNYASSDNNDHFYDDLRTTLYWNPMILLDKTKKRFKFQFFNNDITSRFRLVMEGINDDGKLVHVEKIISKN